MANELWGPLAGLIGTWEGTKGLDVSFHHHDDEIEETIYREFITMKPFGPVDNGFQCLYGLDYRMAAYRNDEEGPFHTEVGYWMWDAQLRQVMRCFMIPRASTLIAGGTVDADATSFRLSAERGSTTYGILANPHLDEHSRTLSYVVDIVVGEDTFSYAETTVVAIDKLGRTMDHTDANTLHLVSREA